MSGCARRIRHRGRRGERLETWTLRREVENVLRLWEIDRECDAVMRSLRAERDRITGRDVEA